MSHVNNSPLSVSVCVPTLNRGKAICKIIECLINQDYGNYEIIVVDQTKQHSSRTNDYLASVSNKIKYYWLTSRKSLTRSRNYCISKSKGEIIIFIDDDVIVNSSFVKSHVKSYTDKSVYAVGGPIVERQRKKYPNIKANPISIFGRTMLNRSSNIRGEINGWAGGNISFRKEVFSIVGLFDEKLPAPFYREDSDLFYKMRKKSLKIVYEPDAKLVHLKESSGGCGDSNLNPSFDERVYMCDTIFHMKNFHDKPIYYLYLFQFFAFVLKFNWSNLRNLKIATNLMFLGIRNGREYFSKHYN